MSDRSKNLIKAEELVLMLERQCVSSMNNKEYSSISKLPFKVMSFVNSMNWRMKECSEAAIKLLDSNLTHPSLLLIRGAMENSAITIKLADVVMGIVERQSVESCDDDNIMRILFGNNYRKDDPFIELYDEKLRADRIGLHVTHADEQYLGFKQYYSCLCEFVHPNSDGVCMSYSCIDIEKDYTEFGPQLCPSHELYEAFIVTLVLSLQIYIEQIKRIDDRFEDFIHVCDFDVVKSLI